MSAARSPARTVLRLAVLVTLAILYAPVVRDLLAVWRDVPTFSYGVVVPFWSAWLLWDRRGALAASGACADLRGLPLVVAGLALLVAGARIESLTLETVSLPLVLAGVAIVALGAARFRRLGFPIAFLALMTPLPPAAVPALALPLQALAAWVTHVTLVVLGIPVHREGLLLHLSTVTLAVTEACSGLRFLLAMAVVGPALAWAVGSSLVGRAVIVLAGLGIAIVGNLVRVAGTALLADHFGPAAAMGQFHVAFGKAVYLVVLAPLALGLLALRRRAARAPVGAPRC